MPRCGQRSGPARCCPSTARAGSAGPVATGRDYGRGGVFPVIPGLNAVARTAAGELVFASSGQPLYGTFAERFASPGGMRFPLPAGAQPEAVAAGVNPGMASWLPLQACQAESGKLGTVLIFGVTGMSGFLAAQNARLLGATRVVGSGRSQPGLRRAAAAGAQTVAISGDRDTDAQALAARVGTAGGPGARPGGLTPPPWSRG